MSAPRSLTVLNLLSGALLFSVACQIPVQKQAAYTKYTDTRDYHSYGTPEDVRVRHVALDLDVLFQEKKLRGTATLGVAREGPREDAPLILDTRDLKIASVEVSIDGGVRYANTGFQLSPKDPVLGSSLTIQAPRGVTHVRVAYETSPEATALQWLTPAQTAGKKQPFLYTQSQAIHARSWIPVQDSPGVRMTYSARVRTPEALLAVMSAKNDPVPKATGDYLFDMPQAIPAYLIALAVGNLEYKPFSPRSGVYAEPSILPKAAREFEDMEKIIQAAEQLYGAYQWDKYDVLILPPSFPYGGMENPRLTFLTPTLLAGDKSMVGVVSHELAHSWSGNLVTNATWRDFWLNEGFTTYFERRIQEKVYGLERSEMEALIEKQEVVDEIKSLPERDQILYVDLKGRDPEEGATRVPYVKGMLLLRRLEELFGRERFDSFLRGYFTRFAFQGITTGDFLKYLNENLLNQDAAAAAKIDLEEWLTRPGMPDSAPQPKSTALNEATRHAQAWTAGKSSLASIPTTKWSAAEWQQFLLSMPQSLDRTRMAELDKAYGFTRSGNAEIKQQWLLMVIRSRYEPAYAELNRFLLEVGRRKYIRPLYQELAKTPDGKKRAQTIYAKARPGYHPISAQTIDQILK